MRREVETRFRFVDLTLVNYGASPLQLSHAVQGFALKDLRASTIYMYSHVGICLVSAMSLYIIISKQSFRLYVFLFLRHREFFKVKTTKKKARLTRGKHKTRPNSSASQTRDNLRACSPSSNISELNAIVHINTCTNWHWKSKMAEKREENVGVNVYELRI